MEKLNEMTYHEAMEMLEKGRSERQAQPEQFEIFERAERKAFRNPVVTWSDATLLLMDQQPDGESGETRTARADE